MPLRPDFLTGVRYVSYRPTEGTDLDRTLVLLIVGCGLAIILGCAALLLLVFP
jgi:hypothetical protein